MIVKIEKDGSVYKTSLAPNLDKEKFLRVNSNYLEIDFEFKKNTFYKLKKNKIVIDQDKTDKFRKEKLKEISEKLIRKTNEYMLMDNIYDLDKDQIDELREFRATLRKLVKYEDVDMPVIPDFIK